MPDSTISYRPHPKSTTRRRAPWLRRAGRLAARVRQFTQGGVISRVLPPFLLDPLRRAAWQVRAVRAAPLGREFETLVREQGEAGPVIIFPPSLDWNTQLFQRPQQLAIALARAGARVFYVQPIVTPGVEAFRQIEARLYLCNVRVETFWRSKSPIIYILTWNRKYVGAFQSPRVIYDYIDEIETFWGDHDQMHRDHQRLVHNSAVVSATARYLYQEIVELRPDALLCPNGVDYAHFALDEGAPGGPPPVDLQPILEIGKPVVGYYGALARWFDYPLYTAVAQRREDLSFVLIGPDYDRTIPPALLELPNVYWLGVKSYQDLPLYLHCFSIATIPFQVNRITHSTSPLKLFEYMAAGKPVVITAMDESRHYPGVLVAEDVDDFAAKLDQALGLKDDPEYVRLALSVARENTWERRAIQLLAALRLAQGGGR